MHNRVNTPNPVVICPTDGMRQIKRNRLDPKTCQSLQSSQVSTRSNNTDIAQSPC
jgi:hypothetical protein